MTVARDGNLSAEPGPPAMRRLARWAEERGLIALATAHHADDQAETLLLRLNRGAGLAGLAAMRPRAHAARQPRHRAAPAAARLAQGRAGARWSRARGWIAADDPANRDPRFDRARLRKALAGSAWLDPARIAASASHLPMPTMRSTGRSSANGPSR